MMRRAIWALAVVVAMAGCTARVDGDDEPRDAADFISGRVSSDAGPEAGVWVIAVTDELPTGFTKIVVSDQEGRFVLPELPRARYRLWVRGYGLVDSSPVPATPGDRVQLTATRAGNAWEAAWIYPANHWLAMLEPPHGDADWASRFKLGCELCHQLGSVMTRYKDRHLFEVGLGKAKTMHATAEALGRGPLLDALTAWSARIVAGQTPPPPRRPLGIERNVVITEWTWGSRVTYAHDEVATDKRNPTRNAHGRIYGVDLARDALLELDPVRHTVREHPIPTRDGFATPWCDQVWMTPAGDRVEVGFGSLGCPISPGITGFEGVYRNPANPHNPMFDADGKIWITSQVRREWDEDLPEPCRDWPGIAGRYHHRQLAVFDPAAEEFELIDTCHGTHHLQFDANGVLWTSGDVYGVGWFDPSAAPPERLGFARAMVDGDGDGRAETPIVGFNYGIVPNPEDGSVWTAQPGSGAPGDRGRLLRYEPASGRFETYVPPRPGSGPRGVDVDGNGIIWVALGGSGHLGRFDRSRCDRHAGLGDQCPQGWTLYPSPGPRMRVDGEVAADFHYYLFVDRFDTLGMGAGSVILNGTGSDSLLVFDPASEAFHIFRVPYPLNTYTRGLDGRIDDPDAGWKGRGLWFTNGLDPIYHSESGRSFVGRIQLRDHPLAH